MNSFKTIMIAAAGMLVLAACQPAAKDTAADEDAVKNGSTAWLDAYNAGDADAIAAMYADDAIMMPPNAPSVTGRDSIAEFIARDIVGSKAAGLTLRKDGSTGFGMSGDTAWYSGIFSIVDSNGGVIGTGKYLEVWQRVNGQWLYVRDMWNSDSASESEPRAELTAG